MDALDPEILNKVLFFGDKERCLLLFPLYESAG